MTATCDYIQACGALRIKAENRRDGEEQMICPRCGANNQDGSKFCVNCGAQLFNPNYNVPPMQQSYNQYQWKRQKGEFYKKTWVLVLSSIFIPPLGIAFSWMASRPKKMALRILLTILLTISSINFMVAGSLIFDGDSAKQETVANSEENHESEREEVVPEEKEEPNMIDVNIRDCHVKYVSSSIETNYVDEPCLVIYYEFTNNSDENKCFDYTIGAKAFQDGVELKGSYFHVNDETKDSSVEIHPGTTVTVASAYTLRNDSSDITLEVSTWLSDKPKASMTISVPEQ